MIGGGEWFPPHPPRGDGPASKVSFIVTTAGHAHPVGASSPRQVRGCNRWPSVRRARQGEALPCMARYDNAYYQTVSWSGRSGDPGETSSIGAVGLPLPAAAGRLLHPITSIICAWTATNAFAAAIRSGAGLPASWASSAISTAQRRSRSAIMPGSIARARESTT